MTITEVQLLEPLRPLPHTSTRTVKASPHVAIEATDATVEVTWEGRRYSYPRGLCVVVSEAAAKVIRVPPKPLGERRPTAGEQGTMALTADGVPVEVAHAMGGKPEEPRFSQRDGPSVGLSDREHVAAMQRLEKPEEPLPTKRPRKRRSKRVAK